MRRKTTSNLHDVLDHMVATLPDSLVKRERVLVFLLEAIPARHPSAGLLREMLNHLHRHQLKQREFCFTGGAAQHGGNGGEA